MTHYENKVIEFEMDDIDDTITYEGDMDDTYLTEDFLTNLLTKIRGCKWFMEGNKTEGTLTFHTNNELTIDWVVKTMGEDWDSDKEEEYSMNVLINYDETTTKVVNW